MEEALAPIGGLQAMAVKSNKKFMMQTVVEVTKKIVETETNIFHFT